MIVFTTAICLVGAAVTAIGRALFGHGDRPAAVRHRLRDARGGDDVALAQWFTGRYFALLFAVNLSLAAPRIVISPTVHPPSPAICTRTAGRRRYWLAAGFAVVSFAGALMFFWVDRREAPRGHSRCHQRRSGLTGGTS